MPITKSAKKALRQSAKRREHNSSAKKAMKNAIKDLKKLVREGKTEEARKQLPAVYKVLDKSAKTNLIKKNTAARYKSRIAKSVAK
ncbi:MAG: 30S ribosomal protein S20 [Candidatus Spechtbacteria bacterium]|nr:30S ribosomal protein S20 [Candidatus Spechtbacteria bacterium]